MLLSADICNCIASMATKDEIKSPVEAEIGPLFFFYFMVCVCVCVLKIEVQMLLMQYQKAICLYFYNKNKILKYW